jgi:4-diphosphocytidyl-2-C-methyl-D-erythritol kinase
LSLGADVPACILGRSAIVSGVGEIIKPINLPFNSAPLLLINPNKPLSTRDVFTRYKTDHMSFSQTRDHHPTFSNWKNVLDFLRRTQNDLETPAMVEQPEIRQILTQLSAQPDCELARMSGSGATCFALFDSIDSANRAEKILRDSFPRYWIQLTQLLRNSYV